MLGRLRPLAEQLGCAFDDSPAGPVIRTNERKATSVPGVFAAGDATVDPKALLSTCRWCDLKPLCRVHERLTPLELQPPRRHRVFPVLTAASDA